MNDEDMKREHLSALADGELQGEDFAGAVAYAGTQEGQSAWRMYHLIGDTLRSAQMAQGAQVADPALLDRLRVQLVAEPQPGAALAASSIGSVAAPVRTVAREAANASVFRWKLAAGFASLVAVVALGWNSYPAPGGGAQVAVAQPPVEAAPALVVTANQAPEQPVMIRDPRLDELLAAQQFGKTTALQMPAGFLRNATFDGSKR